MADSIRGYGHDGLLEIINALPLAIFVIDRNLTVLLANTISSDFTGKAVDKIIGRACGDALGCINHEKSAKGCGFSPVQ